MCATCACVVRLPLLACSPAGGIGLIALAQVVMHVRLCVGLCYPHIDPKMYCIAWHRPL